MITVCIIAIKESLLSDCCVLRQRYGNCLAIDGEKHESEMDAHSHIQGLGGLCWRRHRSVIMGTGKMRPDIGLRDSF